MLLLILNLLILIVVYVINESISFLIEESSHYNLIQLEKYFYLFFFIKKDGHVIAAMKNIQESIIDTN